MMLLRGNRAELLRLPAESNLGRFLRNSGFVHKLADCRQGEAMADVFDPSVVDGRGGGFANRVGGWDKRTGRFGIPTSGSCKRD